ncbi:MAG: hypothetical protein QOH57_449 [Mycobacterium sp.]|nr:hypothetical protein [Mycobacterium sp.]
MNKLVILGLTLVLAMELVTVTLAQRYTVLWVSGAAVAVVLLAGRRLLGHGLGTPVVEPPADGPAESLQRWISRTQTLIRWADASQADWDRHLRPRLAREFMTATGERQGGRDPAAMQATGRMVFGDDLWQWVDPSNVTREKARQPAPGRAALYEILQRLERI